MGKKKDERKRREREAEAQAGTQTGTQTGAQDCGGHKSQKHERGKHEGVAPLAGIAAAVARQMGTPVGRQMIAAGLMAAAGAISRHDAKAAGTRSTPPPAPTPAPAPAPAEPPVQPSKPEADAQSSKASTGPFAGATREPPRSDAAALPPEMAKMLDSVTVGLERMFAGFGKPTRKDPPSN